MKNIDKFKQFKTLFIKEYRTHRKSVLMPAMLIAVFYVIILLTVMGTLLSNDISFNDFPIINLSLDSAFDVLSISFFNILLSIAVSVLLYCSLVRGLLNDDIKHKCVIFHNSYPVSMIMKIGVKLVFALSALFFVSLTIAIINAILFLPLFLMFQNSFNIVQLFSYTSLAFLQGMMLLFIPATLIISLAWMFSAIYQEKTVVKTIITIAVFWISVSIVSNYFGKGIMFANLRNFLGSLIFPRMVYLDADSYWYSLSVEIAILEAWNDIFSFMMLVRLLFASLFFSIGTYFYWKREIV